MALIDRVDAGRQVSRLLNHLRGLGPSCPGLPRGGVVVAYEVAEALGAPLDVIVVRKMGYQTNRSWAWGRSAKVTY